MNTVAPQRELTDDEVFGQPSAQTATPPPRTLPDGTIELNPLPSPKVLTPQRPVQKTPTEVADDTIKSFSAGGARAGSSIVDNVLGASPLGSVLGMLSTAASLGQGKAPSARPYSGFSQIVSPALHIPQTKIGEYAQSVGEMLPNLVAPGGALRKAAAVVLPAIGSQTAGDIAEYFGANPTVQAAARFLGGVGGGLGAGVGVTRAGVAKARTLQDLDAEQSAAWDAVDKSGYRFPKKDVQAAAKDIRALVDDADPDLYANSAKVAAKVERMAARGELSPAQANRLRSQVREQLMGPGSTEVSVGKAILSRIDSLIDNTPGATPLLKDARAKYTQFLKMRDVTNRLDDAGLNQSASGTGGNINAGRQALKPLAKKTSPQRMTNATPAEAQALRRAVSGGPVQNTLRAASAFDPFHGRLGMMLQGGLGLKTGGASLLTIPLGMAATAGEKALAQRNIDHLLKVISNGGGPQKGARVTFSPTEMETLNLGTILGLNRPEPAPAPARRR